MAPPVTTSAHQAAQATLAESAAEMVVRLWPTLDLKTLRGSLPTYSTQLAAVARQYGKASAALAARHYAQEREQAGIRGLFRVAPASPADLDQITEGVKWATRGLWSAEPDIESVQTQLRGAIEKYALQPGRETIIRAVQSDRKAHGWAREVEPGACSFCMLLAIRGAVYRTEQTAGFEAHDHCRCHVQPFFTKTFAPSAEVRRAQQIYDQAKTGHYGGADVRRAFRDALAADRANPAPGAP